MKRQSVEEIERQRDREIKRGSDERRRDQKIERRRDREMKIDSDEERER